MDNESMEICKFCGRSLKDWNSYNKNTHVISCSKKNPHGGGDIKKFFSPARSKTSSSSSTPNRSRSSSFASIPGSPSLSPMPSRLQSAFSRLSHSRSPSPSLSSLFLNDPDSEPLSQGNQPLDESSEVCLTLNLSSSESQTVSTVRDLNRTRKRQLLTDDEMCEGYLQ
jgi:hypothetical protein